MTSNDQNIFPPKVSERATDKLWRDRDMAQCYFRMLTSSFVLLLCCQMSQLLGDLNSVSYWIFFLQKREKRMLANWKLLTRSLLIRERLKKRYDTEVHARPKLPSQESSFVIVCVPSPFPSRGGTVKETYRVFWLVARADKISQFFPRGIAFFFSRDIIIMGHDFALILKRANIQTNKKRKKNKTHIQPSWADKLGKFKGRFFATDNAPHLASLSVLASTGRWIK